MKVTTIEESFYDLLDPRGIREPTYSLIWIITLAICAILCGCKDWEEVALFAKAKLLWFQKELGYPLDRTPCQTLFIQFFRYLDGEAFAACFQNWMFLITQSVSKRHIQLDGKVLTDSGSQTKRALCLVSAFASEYGLTLAQRQTAHKSNEISCMQEILKLLDLKGALVSIAAVGCQTEIVTEIVSKGGDYLLALKGNQQGLHDEVQNFFEQALAADYAGITHIQTKDSGHGRVETRDFYIAAGQELDWLPNERRCR